MPSRRRPIERSHRRILVGLKEIADMARVSRQQASHMVREDWWTADAVDYLAMGTCWRYDEVDALLRKKGYPKEEERPLKNV